jgi:hypothetical protein
MKAMMAILVVLGLVLAAFLVFGHAQGRSLRRASVLNSVSELLSSEQGFRERGVTTTSNRGFRAFSYTNAVMVGTNSFRCELAIESDWIRDFGFVALAADGTVLWIDRELAPSIARTADGRLSMPERFR